MPTLDDQERVEYVALMRRGQDAERIAQLCWIAGGLAGSVMMSWAIAAKSPGHMIPVVFAIAIGFYGALRARQQVCWITSYIEGFHEDPKGAQWFTRLRRLQEQPGYRAVPSFSPSSCFRMVRPGRRRTRTPPVPRRQPMSRRSSWSDRSPSAPASATRTNP